MSNIVKIKGNPSSIQSDIDFCVQITSIGSKSVEDLRKGFFREFMSEYRNQLASASLENSENITFDVEDTTEDLEEITEVESTAFDFMSAVLGFESQKTTQNQVMNNSKGSDVEYVSSGIMIELDDDKYDNSLSSGIDVGLDANYENNIEYVSTGVDIDLDDCDESVEESVYFHNIDKGIEYVSNGVIIDIESEIHNSGDLFEGRGINEINKDIYEYTESGVYLEDEDCPDTIESEDGGGVEYVDSGIFLDSEDEVGYMPVSNNSYSVVSEGNIISEDRDNAPEGSEYQNLEDIEFLIESENSKMLDTGGIQNIADGILKEEENSSDESVISISDSGLGFDLELGKNNDGGDTEEVSLWDNLFEDGEDVWGKGDIEFGSQKELSNPPLVEHEDTSKQDESTANKGNKEQFENIDIPSDIRKFLRSYPMSSIDFVLQYYSKQEIDKALSLGRIYKKKGKLMI